MQGKMLSKTMSKLPYSDKVNSAVAKQRGLVGAIVRAGFEALRHRRVVQVEAMAAEAESSVCVSEWVG